MIIDGLLAYSLTTEFWQLQLWSQLVLCGGQQGSWTYTLQSDPYSGPPLAWLLYK